MIHHTESTAIPQKQDERNHENNANTVVLVKQNNVSIITLLAYTYTEHYSVKKFIISSVLYICTLYINA